MLKNLWIRIKCWSWVNRIRCIFGKHFDMFEMTTFTVIAGDRSRRNFSSTICIYCGRIKDDKEMIVNLSKPGVMINNGEILHIK